MRALSIIAAGVILLAACPDCGPHGLGSGRILPLVMGRGDWDLYLEAAKR